MQAFHIPAPPPYYTNTFLLISDAGHAVIIDPAADVQNYEQILQEHNAVLTTLLCTHGHFDHVGSAEALRRKYHAVLYCEADDLAGDKMYPLSEADHGYAEGQTVTVDELQFTAWHTPGHTPGSVVLLCGEYLFCGDPVCGQHRPHRPGGRQQRRHEREPAQAGKAAHPPGDPGAARPRRVFHLRGGTGQQLLHPQRPARQC